MAQDATFARTSTRIAAVVRGPGVRLSPVLLAFLLTTVLPTVATATYLFVAATDRYVTEVQFMVRGVTGRHVGGLAALFRTFGIARAEDDAFAVHSFMLSRDAVAELDKRLDLRSRFARPDIDRLSRYPRLWRGDTAESLHEFYRDRVSVFYSASQGLSTMRVTSWRAEDSRIIAETLLNLGEELINRMNARATSDSLANAERERVRAEELVLSSQAEITAFRNREMVLDPSLASVKGLEVIGRLSVELAQARTQLAESSASAPGSPALNTLQVRARALQEQIAVERAKIVGGDQALAQKVTEYERLALRREFADRNLGTTSSALEVARQEARRQQIYIETVVRPHAADEATEPRRLRLTATAFVLGFSVFSLLWLVISGAREHSHG